MSIGVFLPTHIDESDDGSPSACGTAEFNGLFSATALSKGDEAAVTTHKIDEEMGPTAVTMPSIRLNFELSNS